MLDGSSSIRRLSRRGALRLLAVTPAAMLVSLGSISVALAQSSSETEAEPEPSATPTRSTGSGNGSGSTRNNRFSPTATPGASPQPSPSGAPVAGAPATGAPAAAPPPPGSSPASPPVAQDGLGWVQNHTPTELWSGPDDRAVSFGTAPAFSYFRVLNPQDGSRIRVRNPLTNGIAYVNAKDVGPSGDPPEWYLAQKNQTAMPARIVGGANIRSTPGVTDGNIVGKAGHNEGVTVLGEVKGSDGDMWYRIGQQQFVHGSLVRVPSTFPPHPGKLIVAELSDPCIVTAYEDGKPVYSTLSLKGTASWATPTGFFTILRRVQNEIMSSEGLGIPRDAPGGYYLKDVLFTQYFTNDGSSIHYNYWSGNWGYSGSHGCLGMSYDDSLWFWEWAEVGTPLVIQE
ncbi:MAG: L,D-transpeptidase family protein [Chloroflexi bacterium]|nr:L,D-transpeptidase family protein [Chloroflexota bacterium]